MEELSSLVKLVDENPENLEAIMALARKYAEMNEYAKAAELLEKVKALDPESVDARYILFQLYEFQEKFYEAAENLEFVLQKNPVPELKYKLAQLWEGAEEYVKSQYIYKELHEVNPKDADVLSALGHVCRILGDEELSIAFYEKLLAFESTNMVALSQLLELYEYKDKFKYYITRAKINELEGSMTYALSSYKKAVPEADNEQEAVAIRFHIAEILSQQEKYMQAIDEYNAILDHFPDDYKAYSKMAKLYNKLDNLHASFETYEKLLKLNSSDFEVMKEFAELCLDMEEYEKAVVLYEQVLLSNSEDLDSATNLAKVYIALNYDEKAITTLDSVIQKDSKNVKAISVLSDYYIIKKEYEKALEQAETIKKLLPKSPFGYRKAAEVYEASGKSFDMHYNYGVFHELKGEKQLAIDEFSIASDLEPSNIDLCLRIADLYEQLGEVYIALEYYQKAYRLNREDVAVLRKMAKIYADKKEYEPLMEVNTRIIELNPSDKDAVLGLAAACEVLSNYDKALVHYKKYLQLAPNSNQSQEINEKINRIESKFKADEDEGFLNRLFKMFSK